MDLIVSTNTKDLDKYIEKGSTGFLLPLTSFSTDFKFSYSLDEIINIRIKYPNIKLFVVMNEMIFNKDLEDITKILTSLNKNNLDGILFYDWSIYQIHKKNNLEIPLIWNQTYMVTNKETADLLFDKGIHYGVLSNEITYEEIEEISKSKMKFFLYLVGYLPVGVSRRKLLTSFFKLLGKDFKQELEVKEDTTKMPFTIYEGEKSTSIFYGKRLNSAFFYQKLSKLPLAYGILKQDDLEDEVFLKILELYAKEKDFNKIMTETGKLIGRNTGFLARKTVFKVKK